MKRELVILTYPRKLTPGESTRALQWEWRKGFVAGVMFGVVLFTASCLLWTFGVG